MSTAATAQQNSNATSALADTSNGLKTTLKASQSPQQAGIATGTAGQQRLCGGTRVWVKSRGTCPFPAVVTSVIVPDNAVVDDLRSALRRELSPLLDHVPKPFLDICYYNQTAKDYIGDRLDRGVTENPLPEVLLKYPGEDLQNPLYFEISGAAPKKQ